MKIIGIFKTGCPSGWSRVSAWDGKFLKGNSAYGTTGGSTTHTHSLDFASRNTLGGTSYIGIDCNFTTWLGGHLLAHTHTMNPASFTTATGNSLPSYVDVVFCSKEDS